MVAATVARLPVIFALITRARSEPPTSGATECNWSGGTKTTRLEAIDPGAPFRGSTSSKQSTPHKEQGNLPKHLIIACDGTWNTAYQSRNGTPCPSNVIRLALSIAELDNAGRR